MKKVKSKLVQWIYLTTPMLEEILEADATPFCTIGVKYSGNKLMTFTCATIDDKKMTEEILLEACKAVIKKYKPEILKD